MRKPALQRERGVAIFLLAVILFNPPLLAIFSAEASVFGIPLLFFYLFYVWAAMIVLLALNAGGREWEAPPSRRDGE